MLGRHESGAGDVAAAPPGGYGTLVIQFMYQLWHWCWCWFGGTVKLGGVAVHKVLVGLMCAAKGCAAKCCRKGNVWSGRQGMLATLVVCNHLPAVAVTTCGASGLSRAVD